MGYVRSQGGAGGGSPAPNHALSKRGRRRRCPLLGCRSLAMLAASLFVLAVAPAAQASKNVVGYFGSQGPAIDEFPFLRQDIAINNTGAGPGATAGDLYASAPITRMREHNTGKILQFHADGSFVRAFGWDVVSFGPDNTGPNEEQTVSVPSTVTAGTFTLTVPTVYGEGVLQANSDVIEHVITNTGRFQVGQPIRADVGYGSGPIPLNTTITAVGDESLTLSQPVTFAPNGDTELFVEETTGPIAYNAAADAGAEEENVQASLEALPGIGASGVAVAGGPGASGTPFTVTFTSSANHLAHNDVRLMKVSNVLTGGVASIATLVEGGGLESCNAGTSPADACHNPEIAEIESAGAYMDTDPKLAVDQATGTVFATARGRILVYRADGTFEGVFGWGVLDGAAELQFCTSNCHADLTGSGAGEFNYYSTGAIAVDPSSGNLYVANERYHRVDEFSFTRNGANEVTGVAFVHGFGWGVDTGASEFQICTVESECNEGLSGAEVGEFGSMTNIAVDSSGVVYVPDSTYPSTFRVQSFTPALGSYTPAVFAPGVVSASTYKEQPEEVAVGAADHVFVTKLFEEGASTCYNGLPSVEGEKRILELDSAGALLDTHLACAAATFEWDSVGVTAPVQNASTGVLYFGSYLYTASYKPNGGTDDVIFIVDNAEPATATIDSVTPTTAGATVVGTINPNGPSSSYPHASATSYQLEYKPSAESTWSKFGSPVKVGAGFEDHEVTIRLGGLEPNTSYDVRLIAQKPGEENAVAGPQTLHTLPTPPTISGLSSSALTAHSVDLLARINPHGTDTTYHFEYGPTPAYGQQTPESDVGAAFSSQNVEAHVEELSPIGYHFRVVATNAYGTTASGDQTFTFYPPACPNALVRQQNGSEYLPDCRSYELVSPPEAGNIILKSFYRPAPYATNPPRFLYGGIDGALKGTEATNSYSVDTYVATRTSSGWKSTYPGIPGSQAIFASFGMADMGLDKFLSFKSGGVPAVPYIYGLNDEFLGRWPANVNEISGGEEASGAFQPSPDFSHLAFSSTTDFDPEMHGLTEAPGSAYDYDVARQTTTLISKTAMGADIQQDPGNSYAGEVLLFAGMRFENNGETPVEMYPGVSTDGSHILMMTSTEPPCFSGCTPDVHLYMRVDDAITYEIAGGKAVHYVGMTSDAKKVFFTSALQLTGDDHDTSTDLYMWSEKGELEGKPLTRLSAGSGAGDTDSCVAGWTDKCSVQPVEGELGTDYPIATESGDIYFYSPELLDGPEKGLEGARNLYVYRDGRPRFVARLNIDGSDPLTRIQVSPDGAHAAFVTASKLTGYENAEKSEMYSFNANTGAVVCVSCIPSGEPPSSNVSGSVSGLFMSDDGRTFFSTDDALVPRDTNEGSDVYEYTDGRPQLISSGIGATQHNAAGKVIPVSLMGVGVDGTDVYFSTFETLVPQDHNGAFLKFYDARTDGGFLTSPEAPPCEAADECHGVGSAPPPPAGITSDGALGAGGNVGARRARRKKHRHHHRARHRAHRRKNQHRRHRKGIDGAASIKVHRRQAHD